VDLTVSFRLIEDAVRRMEAESIPVDLTIDVRRGVDPVDPIDIDLKMGVDVGLSEIDTEPQSGVLAYKDRQVVIYIQDHSWGIDRALQDGSEGRKVHVTECGTLDRMRREGRYERYVATTNVSGEFYITGQDDRGRPRDGTAKLRVCKNCLSRLNYLNYRDDPNVVFRSFEWTTFFDSYKSYFITEPSRAAGEFDGGYSSDWSRISGGYKKFQEFKCENCGVDLRANSRLLHVHHISGNKRDNAWLNLRALCAVCHRSMPMHEHMYVSREDTDIIRRLRQSQGLQVR